MAFFADEPLVAEAAIFGAVVLFAGTCLGKGLVGSFGKKEKGSFLGVIGERVDVADVDRDDLFLASIRSWGRGNSYRSHCEKR
jgi:dienelactone hydrolase